MPKAEKSGGSAPAFSYPLSAHFAQLQQFVGTSSASEDPAGKKSSTGKLTLSKSSQGSSQELHAMFPTA